MRRRRVILSAAVFGVIAVVATSAVALSARTPDLAPTTPDALVASVLKAMDDPTPVSGTLSSHVDLGLPSFGGVRGAADPAAILGGDHTVRIWSSKDGFRIDDLLPLAQRSLYVDATEAWAWDSETFTAYRLAHPAGTGPAATRPHAPASALPAADPLEMARRALSSIDATTSVTLAKPRSVAGRDAYVLRLAPRSERTLVGSIEIAVDAARRLPLGVAVFARGATKPAVSVGFSTIGFGPIDPTVYRFTPPAGVTIRTTTVPAGPGRTTPEARETGRSGMPDARTIGSGWETVVAFRMSVPSSSRKDAPNIRDLLPYSGPLLSLRLVERGDHAWVAGGFVPQSILAEIAPQLK